MRQNVTKRLKARQKCVDDENAISKNLPLLIAQDTQQCTEQPTQIRGCVLVPRTQKEGSLEALSLGQFFSILINDMMTMNPRNLLVKFADDITLSVPITASGNSGDDSNKEVQSLIKWADENSVWRLT